MPMEVKVVPPDPRWPGMFADESRRITHALGDNAVRSHHIGSTSIDDVVAKPIIDILMEVKDIHAVDHRTDLMVALGYESMGEFGIPGRRYFRRDNDAGVRTHHVHVFGEGSPNVTQHLAFRDFMNAHPHWAKRYSELKSALVRQHPDSIELYMEGKDGFIKRMNELALRWSQSQRDGGHPPAPPGGP